MNEINYPMRGRSVRRKIVQIAATAGRAHMASAFSIIEIVLVLYDKIMKYDAQNPSWDARDRFILSKGHGCLGLYPVLAEKGFFPEEELFKFCSSKGILGGHPEHLRVPGIEASTGALGHGLSLGMGMALRAKMDQLDYKTFVLVGDGECNEGSVWEAALGAAKHRLDNLIVLVDYNKHQSYGPVKEICNLEPFVDKWKSFGWEVREVDMDQPHQLETLLSSEVNYDGKKPIAIICHTIKGKGISFCENNLEWHHKSKLTPEEIKALYQALEE